MTLRVACLILAIAAIASANSNEAGSERYAGPEVCARCHRAIADTQSKTAMANTWRGRGDTSLPANFDEKKTEASGSALHYEVRRAGEGIEFSVTRAAGGNFTAPVRAIVGGNRHGLSFLFGVDKVGGIPIERSALIEGRYALSHGNALVLSPGFLKERPTDFEEALGRVLSPTFEERCLTCHGKPNTLGAGEHGGVHCESCHSPAASHVNSMTGGNTGQPLVRPKELKGAQIMDVCAQCHSGLSTATHSDPMPEDVLVSSQVPALRNSECFIQSGENLTCTECHNPHRDSAAVSESSVNVCLRCHSLSAPTHAAICPVNRAKDCIGCHMPSVDTSSFHLTDHWIRVHSDTGQKTAQIDDNLRSQVAPRREFLRLIVVETDEQAKIAVRRLAAGESFSTVAHDLSVDPTAPGGGYIGEMQLSEMDPKLAAAVVRLRFGDNSEVIALGDKQFILHRLPRDFKWQADRLFREASDLNDRGDRTAAIEKDKQALQIYPYFLRALVLMGTMMGQTGDANRASEILRFAVQFYPKDAPSQFDLALTLGKQPVQQIEALRRTIELDPDMVAAYQTLGAALYSTGQTAAAIETFRSGLRIDPLSAVLYYNLGLALKDQGDIAGGERALALAAKLDPEIASRKANSK